MVCFWFVCLVVFVVVMVIGFGFWFSFISVRISVRKVSIRVGSMYKIFDFIFFLKYLCLIIVYYFG